jgi:hypothetical protein
MPSKEEQIVKRSLFIGLGICCLVLCTAGISKNYILHTRGVKGEARITNMKLVHVYSAANRFTPDKYEVKVVFLNQNGRAESRDIVLSRAEKQKWSAEAGEVIPFIYVPGSDAYSVSTVIPSLTESYIALALLLPLVIF